MPSRIALAIAGGLVGLLSCASHAGPILAPLSATASIADRSSWGTVSQLFDQSGLSAGYVAGVTDFDAYLATNPTHDNNSPNGWGGANGVFSANVDFDLGGTVTIESFALWNRGLATQGIRNFSLLASADSSFTTTTLLGSFTASAALGSLIATLPEVFGFAATEAAFVRLQIDNTWGICCITFGEVAFEGTATAGGVPEPGTLALVAVGALAGWRRRPRGDALPRHLRR